MRVTVPAVRLLWVPLLLAPAGVVFVATRTAIDPIAGTERVDIAPQFPAATTLPTAAVGITTPTRHVTVRLHARRPAHTSAGTPAKRRIVSAPRPVYVVPKKIVTHVVTVRPRASHTPKPIAPVSKPKPKPTPVPTPTPTPTPAPTSPPPTTPTPAPAPPPQPPEPPAQPTPTPAAPPSPAPTPAAPTPVQGGGDGDDRRDGTGDTRPGNGFGDRNHEHTGPPGQSGGHGHNHN